ncbi:hypothetical protein P152DRAFT_449061 [Eremomyces bilateralis CBS 781.70]|uniref:ATP synthase protein 8 n=1 Tax=Eremomyces bilateralis CBS 781.70 TaxID=1392243 RepID=A0A6G1G4Y2_9PEZI|nr:uncharacterized protein P152DRAFT_449061 [Eremomyces bilateralis CBS 781.70]KAF1812970.1 hypothetical protein P152DRAFT_449061 [Eremomyces bilateralis CBS 781.70]
MSSSRLFRPLVQGLQRQSLGLQSTASRSLIARAASTSAKVSTVKVPSFRAQQARNQLAAPAKQEKPNYTMLYAAMPQLIPFYFVNEVTTAFILIPALIYVFTKYILPKNMRTMLARLFISKL